MIISITIRILTLWKDCRLKIVLNTLLMIIYSEISKGLLLFSAYSQCVITRKFSCGDSFSSAKAFKTGWINSPIATASYSIMVLPPEMIFVQGGTFQMGDIIEQPVHSVTLSSFYIGK